MEEIFCVTSRGDIPTVYAEECQGASSTDTRSTASKMKADSRTTLDFFVIKQPCTVSVQVAPDVLKKACLEHVTVNGRPFSLMGDSGFKKIVCPIVEAMGNSVSINQSNIREMVIEITRIEREGLSEELSDKLLMLKIDAATCGERAVLGINVQYTDGQQILLITSAVGELGEKHTGSYVSSIVRGVLGEYNLTLNQIYLFTTDNGEYG